MVPYSLKTKAYKLRKDGYSYNHIAAKLRISKSTLSRWFSGIPFNPNQFTKEKILNGPRLSAENRINARKARTNKIWDRASSELGILSTRDIFILGLGLYLGEGSKTNSIVRFSNSDPMMVQIFITWMRKCFDAEDQNFALRIHAYPETDLIYAEKYWLKVCKLPQQCLRKSYIDRRLKIKSKAGKSPFGTVHVSVLASGNPKLGVELFRLLEGYSKDIITKLRD